MAQRKAGGFLGWLWLAMQSLLLIPVQVWGSAAERISLSSTIARPSCTAGNNKEQSSFHKSVSRGLHFPHTALCRSFFSKQEIRSLFVVWISCFRKTFCSELPNDKEKSWLPATIGQSEDKSDCRRKRFAETSCNITITWNSTWFAQPRSAPSHTAPNFSLSSNGYELFWGLFVFSCSH